MNNGASGAAEYGVKHRTVSEGKRFVPLTIDWLFADCMQNEKVLQGFLAAAINRPISRIEDIRVENRYLPKEGEENKQGILDVRTLVVDVGEFDIELQVDTFEFWNERSIFYTSKMFTEGIRKGVGYGQCRKVIHIGILGFNLCDETNYFHSIFHLREDRDNFMYSDLLEFHVIELRKLEGEIRPEDRDLHKWALLIAAGSEEERMMIEKDPYIEEAMRELERLSNDPAKREEYERRQENLWDYKAQKQTFENIGLRKGMEKGMEKGTALTKTKIVKNMLKEGMSYEKIAMLADVSIDFVKGIAEE